LGMRKSSISKKQKSEGERLQARDEPAGKTSKKKSKTQDRYLSSGEKRPSTQIEERRGCKAERGPSIAP